MGGLGLIGRRRAISSSPVKSEWGEIFAKRIGWYTFEGRSNDDADREVVQDKSGRGLPMQVKFTNWGGGDAYTKNGYSNDKLYVAPSAVSTAADIRIPLSAPLSKKGFTIILERGVYGVAGMKAYASTMGSVATTNSNTSPINIEYIGSTLTASELTTSAFGSTAYKGQINDEIIWLTAESYCGKNSGSYLPTNDYEVSLLLLAKIRPGDFAIQRASFKSIHIFNDNLTTEQVVAYIKAFVNPEYNLP